MNSSKCEHVRQLARQVRQRHMIHRQPITGITETGNYNITVCSSSVVNGVACMSEACASPIIEGKQN